MNFDFIEDPELRKRAEDEYKASIDALRGEFTVTMDETVEGLKTKNSELLDEKKKIQEALKEYDFDPAKAKEALDFLDENADAQLIKDGKIDELIDKRTSTMRSEHEDALTTASEALVTANTRGDKYSVLYKGKMVDDALVLAAQKANVLPEALADVLMHGRGVFTLGEDSSIESRDEKGDLVRTADDKIMTAPLWIEERRKESPHWWPGSNGAGALGGDSKNTDMDTALLTASKNGDQKEYNRLRDLQSKE